MKEQLIYKIRTIAESEKFKNDAFFLCGSSTGEPNQGLLQACEKYLASVNDGAPDKNTAEQLIKELEKAVNAAPDNAVVNGINTNTEYMKEILKNKEALLDA